jgi:hypothetical protein
VCNEIAENSAIRHGILVDAPCLDRDIDDLANQAERFRHDVAEKTPLGNEAKRSGQPKFTRRLS